MPLYQGDDVRVLRAADQIAFPVTRHRSIGHLSGPLSDRHGAHDLSLTFTFGAGAAATTHGAPGAQMVQQLFLKLSARLDKQAAVNGFVRHAPTVIARKLFEKTLGDLLGGPVLSQPTHDRCAQPRVLRQLARLGSSRPLPGALIGAERSVVATPAVPLDLSADARCRPPE